MAKIKEDLNLARTRAGQLKRLRSGFLLQLFLPKSQISQKNPEVQVLNDIANSFSRFAAYQQTAFDSGGSRSSSSNDATSMQRQVERAITQVLGRATGRGANGFVSALNSAFPTTTTSEGQQVSFTPSRSIVSLYRSGGTNNSVYSPGSDGYGNGMYPQNSVTSASSSSDGYAGTISARQANLYRQASIIVSDALHVLDGLTPFDPKAETDQVEALRALIRSDINSLIEEFGRVDEPRKERVLAYFSALDLHINGFGRIAFLNEQETATVIDETQVAGFELLQNYNSALSITWNNFLTVDAAPTSFSLSQRVERANILLPSVAQVNIDFEAAMDSVGFTEGERRSPAAKFSRLRGFDIPQNSKRQLNQFINSTSDPRIAIDALLPDITVFDLTEWVDRFSNLEGPSILTDSGVFGLDFITDQADQLFWVIAPIVIHIELGRSTSASASPSLEQILSNERVHFALNDLLGQLDSLADLSVVGGDENIP